MKYHNIFYAFGGLRERNIPFNKEIIRAVKFWEKETGLKFHGKILANPNYSCFNFKNILLSRSQLSTLFHELTHYKHHGKSANVKRDAMSYYYYHPFLQESPYNYPISDYYRMPSERLANKQSRILVNRFKYEQNQH
jgi:hypothetical protein